MQRLISVARILGPVLGIPAILGVLWFYPTLRPLTKAYGIAACLSLLIVPVIPRRLYSSAVVRMAVSTAAAVGIGLTIAVMQRDLTQVNGANIPAFAMRAVQALVMAMLGVEAVFPRRATQSPSA